MAKHKSFLTMPHAKGWAVKREGSNKVASVYGTQMEAWNETKRIARGTGGEALLQDKDGKIKTRNTYIDPDPKS